MRFGATCFALGAALAVTGLLTPATSAQAVEAKAQFSPQPYFPITGTCAMEISPDTAVIVGGVSSSALKPTDAVEQLEKQLALMRSYVAEKHGELQMLERVRTLKNPQPGREDSEPPFQVIQRLQATFPAEAPVDAILQKLIELGMDRFGDNVLNNYNRREAVIRFRISDFDARMNDFEKRCTTEAWKQWCATAGSDKDCASRPPPVSLELQAFNMRSKETLMRPDGNSAPWQWNVNRGQHSADPPDLLGNLTVHLEGFANLTYHTEDEKP
ncbi:MAG: SIMPL domain-containing protein [Candidatus Acidiferrales bacterium]